MLLRYIRDICLIVGLEYNMNTYKLLYCTATNDSFEHIFSDTSTNVTHCPRNPLQSFQELECHTNINIYIEFKQEI